MQAALNRIAETCNRIDQALHLGQTLLIQKMMAGNQGTGNPLDGLANLFGSFGNQQQQPPPARRTQDEENEIHE